jgi:tetratricopeptide (TPR) repeat protein
MLTISQSDLRELETAAAGWYQQEGLSGLCVPRNKIGRGEICSDTALTLLTKQEMTWEQMIPFLEEFSHLMNAGEYRHAARLLSAINPMILRAGYLREIITRRWVLSNQLPDVGDSCLEAENLVLIGEAELRRGALSKGITRFEDAIDVFEKDPGNLDLLSCLPPARETGSEATVQDPAIVRSEIQCAGNAQERGQLYGFILTRLGETHFHSGHFQDAINLLMRAKIAFETVDVADKMRPIYAECLDWIGVCFRSAGDLDKGLSYHKRACAVLPSNGNLRIRAHIIANIGAVYLKKENKPYRQQPWYHVVPLFWEKSLKLARKANDIAWTCHYTIDNGYMNTLLAAKHMDTPEGKKQLEHAKNLLDEGLDTARKYHLNETITRGLLNLGNLEFVKGYLQAAEKNYKEGLGIAKRKGILKTQWPLEHNIGNVHRRCFVTIGENVLLEKARKSYQQAISTLYRGMATYDDDEARRGFVAQRRDAIKSLVCLLLAMNEETQAETYAKTRGYNILLDFFQDRRAGGDLLKWEQEHGDLNFFTFANVFTDDQEFEPTESVLRNCYYLLSE